MERSLKSPSRFATADSALRSRESALFLFSTLLTPGFLLTASLSLYVSLEEGMVGAVNTRLRKQDRHTRVKGRRKRAKRRHTHGACGVAAAADAGSDTCCQLTSQAARLPRIHPPSRLCHPASLATTAFTTHVRRMDAQPVSKKTKPDGADNESATPAAGEDQEEPSVPVTASRSGDAIAAQDGRPDVTTDPSRDAAHEDADEAEAEGEEDEDEAIPEAQVGLMDWSKSSGDPFKDRELVNEWIRETTLFGDTDFPCPKCGYVFKDREKRRRHLVGDKERKASCGPLAGLYGYQSLRPKQPRQKQQQQQSSRSGCKRVR